MSEVKKTKKIKAGVIGNPIGHSLSPLIHGHWLEKYEIEGTYDAIDIAPDALKEKVQDLIEQGYDGFNVTVPHKQTIMELCADIDANALAIGAVNTVLIKDKKLYGSNTDGFGFVENIKEARPEFRFTDKIALVIGAGGAARAIIHALDKQGVSRIIITNRTRERAQSLRDIAPQKIQIVEWDKRHEPLPLCDLIVNTTSLGMTGQPPLCFDITGLKASALVNDIVYKPLMTDLLIAAQTHNYYYVTGIGMLLHQARPAFEKWTGIMPQVDDDLRQKCTR